MLVLAVGTSRAARAADEASACYTARCYCVLLAVRMRVRRAAACYTYSRSTCCRLFLALVIPNEMKDVSRKVTFSAESRRNICHESR